MGDLLGLAIQSLFVLIPLGLGLLVGRTLERRHFARLVEREAALGEMVVSQFAQMPGADPAKVPQMLTGEAVISSDYFKSFLASFRKLIGGELRSYNTLLERARREALLRVMEQAHERGYNAVANVRYQSVDVAGASKSNKQVAQMVSIVCAATAYRRVG